MCLWLFHNVYSRRGTKRRLSKFQWAYISAFQVKDYKKKLNRFQPVNWPMVIQVPYHKLKGRIQKDRERIGLNIKVINNNNKKYTKRYDHDRLWWSWLEWNRYKWSCKNHDAFVLNRRRGANPDCAHAFFKNSCCGGFMLSARSHTTNTHLEKFASSFLGWRARSIDLLAGS